MKALVALVGLITATLFPGEAAVAVKIRAYNATGEVDLKEDIVQGTRLLLTCDVEGLPEGTMVISYKWYHSCSTGRCEIREGYPYYTAVNDTLLVDATSWEGRPRRHFCEVKYQSDKETSGKQTGFTTLVRLTDSSAPFLFTPTSFVPNNTLITDVQQITGSNGQQWINCTIGRAGRSVVIYFAVNSAIITSSINTATISPRRGLSNGLYYCRAGGSQRYYVSLFLNTISDSNNLVIPTVSGKNSSMWNLTSPDGSQVERYIVEFECRVRNMTFVEKYMSVSASEGTGQVATSVSCFGGLGQLYRVKVWAVSGPNISQQPAVKLVNTDGPTLTTQVMTPTPTAAGSTRTPSRVTTSTRSEISSSTPSGTPSLEQACTKTEGIARSIIAVPLSISALIFLASITTFTAGVVMLVRAKRVLHYSSQSPPPDTDHYEMVDEREKRAPLGAGVYEEVDKQDTQTDERTKHYQELGLSKIERSEYASIKD